MEQLQNFDDLPDIDLDDVPDLPDFVTFPEGAIRAGLKLAIKQQEATDKREASRYIEARFSFKEIVELKNPDADTSDLKPGNICTARFNVWDNENAAGAFKKLVAGICERTGVKGVKQIVEACSENELVGVGIFTHRLGQKTEDGSPRAVYIQCGQFNLD
jgi:hypothetical protein